MNDPTPPNPAGSPNAETVLCREVIEAARRAAAERIGLAERQAADNLAAARREAEREVEAYLAGMEREADRRCASIRASIPMEIRRRRAALREAEIGAIRDEALRRLQQRDPMERRTDLLTLIPLAVAAMDGGNFMLRLSPADRPSVDDAFLGQLDHVLAPRSVRLTASFDLAIPPGGVVVETEDGRQRWDNTVASRCARLWPELRLRIAEAAGWLDHEGSV